MQDRVGGRLSPLGNFNDMSDAEPEVTFGTIAQVLSDLRFAYLHIVNPGLAAIEKGNAPDARFPGRARRTSSRVETRRVRR